MTIKKGQEAAKNIHESVNRIRSDISLLKSFIGDHVSELMDVEDQLLKEEIKKAEEERIALQRQREAVDAAFLAAEEREAGLAVAPGEGEVQQQAEADTLVVSQAEPNAQEQSESEPIAAQAFSVEKSAEKDETVNEKETPKAEEVKIAEKPEKPETAQVQQPKAAAPAARPQTAPRPAEPRAPQSGGRDFTSSNRPPMPKGGFAPRPQQGQGSYQQRPGGQSSYQQRPGGQSGGYQQRPAGQSGGYQQRPAGQGGYQQRPAGQGGGYQQRPAGQGGYQQRPGGQSGYQQRPAGQGGVGAKASDAASASEKERVSNYDPNRNQYQRVYDPERKQPKQKKAVMKEIYASAGGVDDDRYRVRKNKRGQIINKPIETIKIENAVMTTNMITVKELTEKIGKPAGEIIKKLFLLGIMATINQELDFDTALMIAAEFGVTLTQKLDKTYEETMQETHDALDDDAELIVRPPIVTVMGHVDHGKTSLLDAIRSANVTKSEAGGITQHIGAYTAKSGDKSITFIDTPGHEAFTSMRARGANATDIVILVVAANDGIMPQTIEAISHAKAADVPIIVAINKMDLPTANPDRVMQQLTEYDLVPEAWGGDTVIMPVSALTGEGLPELLEMVLLVSEVLDLKANPGRLAKGIIVEAQLDKGRGPVATVLVQNGTLKVGDTIVAGTAFGRVRAMVNDKGEKITQAGPSTPAEVIGFSDVPLAGDSINAVNDEKLVRQVAQERRDNIKAAQLKAMSKVTLEDLYSQISEGGMKVLNVIVKADVQGSVEAMRQALEKIENAEIRVKSIHGGVGAINESDVMLAATANAIIIGFNVRPDTKARAAAEEANVDMRMYRVIYNAIEDVENATKGMLTPKFKESFLGSAQVRQVFKVTGSGTIAGSYVTEGHIRRNAQIRLVRDGVTITEGKISSLRRFKDDVREVAQGYECGIGIENYSDVKEGDVMECFIMEQIEV